MDFKNLYKVMLFVAGLSLLTGCERVAYYEIVPLDGYLQTPKGKFEFKSISKEEAIYFNLDSPERISHTYLTAGDETIKVFFSLSTTKTLTIVTTKKDAEIEMLSNGTYLQIDNGERHPALPSREAGKSVYKKRLYKNRDPLDFWSVKVGLFRPTTYDAPKEFYTGNKKYKYNISFTVDSVAYLIDLPFTFEKKHRLDWDVGVPGM
jgi:hypothetical protein